MPTENEKKYVLELNCENEIKENCRNSYNVIQGYLVTSKGVTLRLRKSTSLKNNENKYYITFKFNSEKRVVEIEKSIDKRDFEDIWSNCLNKLYKIRYKFQNWDIDFFKDHNDVTYFALAECEMEEGQLEPPNGIPIFISNNLLYRVENNDTRFSSKTLSDVRYSIELYKNIKKGSLC